MTSIYIYRCKRCGTVAAACCKAEYGDPWRCLCRSMLSFLYSIPITTDEHRRWAAAGIYYNPGIAREPQRTI